MPYSAIKKAGKGLFGTSLVLHRVKGRRRVFTGMKRFLAKEFQELIKEKQPTAQALRSASDVLEDLCPSCFLPLGKNLFTCPECKVTFKRPKTALIKSLMLPGWGDVYLGHRALGVLELLGSIVVWAVVISALLAGGESNVILAAIILVFYNGLDGLLTLHMAKKGYSLATQ